MSKLGRLAFIFLFAISIVITFASAQVNITDCQELNIMGESYSLQNDINSASPNQNCFEITAPHITLECNSHSINISGPMQTAISIEEKLATVKNCQIMATHNLSKGVTVTNAVGAKLLGNNFLNSKEPLTVIDSNGLSIKGGFFVSNKAGIQLVNSSNGQFTNIHFVSQPYTISFVRSNDNTLEDLWANSCIDAEACLIFTESSNNFFERVFYSNAGKRFIYVTGESTENVLRDGSFDTGLGNNDIEIEDANSNLRLLNMRYSGSEKVNPASELGRWWYYRPVVLYAGNNTPVENASLTIYDGRNFNMSFTTNTNGITTLLQALKSYEIVNATKYDFTYIINASKEGYLPDGVIRSITDNSQDILLLDFDFSIGNNQTNTTSTEETVTPIQEDRRNLFGSGCLVDWTCTQWSACSEGTLRTRICSPSVEGCYARPVLKPAEVEACPELDQLSNPVALSSEPDQVVIPPYGLITGAVIGTSAIINVGAIMVTLLLLIILALYVVMGRARAAQKRKISSWLKKAEWSLLIIIVILLLITLFA